MEILKASIKDYDLIHAIAVPSWQHTYSSILSAEQLDYMLTLMYSHDAITEQISIKGHHFLLAAEDGQYLGFASYEINSVYEATKIHKLYVLPGAQGRGVGKALVTVIENTAKAHGNNKLLLNVNRYNPAVNFYLKTGFAKIGQEDINIGNGYLMEDYIMQKPL
ncbi:GNAT family N-acetyltransferase [Flavobacterium subsaxonicum]|uniref:Acetyltransferase n=1 Tax=Flavobacterium subsaxonicum WB 4.1-42 = DSM 21790 TaxID=1121898 RepID=A0A0A2MUP2_9FLAO|nr:GNAT family N-acetyltransferase [Flavobacterium subsaxonicum]KGO91945.1 acetyltransferase [Flavobacterium subsaxonicum WB 4.1-42 = DSM 21790]